MKYIALMYYQFSSVQFSHSVVSDSLWPHGLQQTRLPCPLSTPRACSNSSPSSHWCHPTVSSPVIPFSSCLQSFLESGSFPMSQVIASGGEKYWSFSFSISPSDEYSGLISFRLDWLDLISVHGTLKSLLWHHSSKAPIYIYNKYKILYNSVYLLFFFPCIYTGKVSNTVSGI